jgi:hypothetical protein
MIVYWAFCVFRQASARAALRIGVGVLSLLIVVQWGIDTHLLHARRAHLTQMLETFDLVAIRCAGGNAAIPAAFLRQDAQTKMLCDVFDPLNVDRLYFVAGSPLRQSTDHAALRELGDAWRHAVVTSPGEYLAHRFRVFTGLLGLGTPDALRMFWSPSTIANRYGFGYEPNAVTDMIGASVALGNAVGLYDGLAWLIVAAIVAAIAWRNRRTGDVAGEAALALSAICYTLPYFFVALAPDYRYIYWTVVATAVAAVLTLLGGMARGSNLLSR